MVKQTRMQTLRPITAGPASADPAAEMSLSEIVIGPFEGAVYEQPGCRSGASRGGTLPAESSGLSLHGDALH